MSELKTLFQDVPLECIRDAITDEAFAFADQFSLAPELKAILATRMIHAVEAVPRKRVIRHMSEESAAGLSFIDLDDYAPSGDEDATSEGAR